MTPRQFEYGCGKLHQILRVVVRQVHDGDVQLLPNRILEASLRVTRLVFESNRYNAGQLAIGDMRGRRMLPKPPSPKCLLRDEDHEWDDNNNADPGDCDIVRTGLRLDLRAYILF